MGIAGINVTAVVKKDHLTIPSVGFHSSGKNYRAVRAGKDWVSLVGRDINAAVKNTSSVTEGRRETTFRNREL
jgi:hypothetical protein